MAGFPVVVWFRRDLRLGDHPALAAAAKGPLLPVFVFDETAWGRAQLPRLAASLFALDTAFRAKGGRLVVRRGKPAQVLPGLMAETGARQVFWNRDPAEPAPAGLPGREFPSSLLFEPGGVRNAEGGPYKVFTPYWKALRRLPPPPRPLPEPDRLGPIPEAAGESPAGTGAAGEATARARLESFLDAGLAGYLERRDIPALAGTSGLSVPLAFGELSARQVWWATVAAMAGRENDGEGFLRQLAWREFAYHSLAVFPQLPERNLNESFDAYPWRDDPQSLAAWQEGRTGFPLVDAGMRELAATGTMHNRVRMVAGSFLVRLLGIHWRAGLAWFRDRLLDHDPALNAMNWQWVAGTGIDAQPFFRIFNPAGQAARHDPDGAYVRRWAPQGPAPILDYTQARRQALAAYRGLPKIKPPTHADH
ncbi:MAG: DNA photolyase family protein [Magnetospirillum sp. WYHS-4]